MNFKKFSDEISSANDKIILKNAIKSERKGKARFRDKIVFGKLSWGEALTYLGIVQTGVIFFGLMDNVILNINAFLLSIGIGYQFPVKMSVLAAFVFILGVALFGIFAVRFMGTYRSSNELSSKMNPGIFLLWEQNERLNKKIEELELKVEGKDDNNRSSRVYRK